jgi:hypothetical protein
MRPERRLAGPDLEPEPQTIRRSGSGLDLAVHKSQLPIFVRLLLRSPRKNKDHPEGPEVVRGR